MVIRADFCDYSGGEADLLRVLTIFVELNFFVYGKSI